MSQNININILPGYFTPVFHMSQYDVGRVLIADLVDSSGAYTIPAGATAELIGTKPSGFGFTLAGTISGNTVTFTTTATVTAEFGRIKAEIRIKVNSDIIGTANLVLDIEKSPHPEGTTDGDGEVIISQITLLVNQAQAIADSLHALSVSATAVGGGDSPTAAYDPDTNTITFGIPKYTITDDGNGNITIS